MRLSMFLLVAAVASAQSNGRSYPAFAFNLGTLAAPTASPGAGTYSSTQTVTLSGPSGAAICYTTDGSTPTAPTPGTCSHGTTYSGSITVSTTETITAISTQAGWINSTSLVAAYTISSTVNCGETTGGSGGSTDSGNNGFPIGTPCTTGSDSNGYAVNTIFYYVASPTSSAFDLGVYSNSSNAPATRLCHASTGTITPTSGWNSVSISGCGTLSASTLYWVAYLTNTGSINQYYQSGNCPGTSLVSVYQTAGGQSSLPTPFGASGTLPGCYANYMVLTPQ